MSTSVVRKFAFFGPYITGPNAQELRGRLHEAHIERLVKLRKAGVITHGGPAYNDDGAGEGLAPADRPFGGSFFLIDAESRAKALEIIAADVYYTEGMWDIPNLRLVEYQAVA